MGICKSFIGGRNESKNNSQSHYQADLGQSDSTQEKIIQSYKPLVMPLSSHYLVDAKQSEARIFTVTLKDKRNDKQPKRIVERHAKLVGPEYDAQMDKMLRWIRINHPHVQKHYDIYEEGNSLFFLKEQVDGIQLFEFIRNHKITELKLHRLMLKIFLAFQAIHQAGIFIGNICSENIILLGEDMQNFKFKIVSLLEVNSSVAIFTTAPEAIRGQPSFKSDVWSLGVILHFCLSGIMPFDGKDKKMIKNNIIRGSLNFESQEWDHVSETAISLLKKMLTYQEKRRPTLQSCMNDSWFRRPKSKLNVRQKDRIQLAINRIHDFNCRLKIQQATLLILAENENSSKEVQKLMAMFRRLDTDRNGQLSKQELLAGYKQIMDPAQAQKEVDYIFQQFDADGSGQVDYEEFLLFQSIKAKMVTKEKLLQIFDQYDLNKNGQLSMDEIKRLLLRLNLSNEEFKLAFAQFDKNADQQISKAEFLEGMQQIQQT